MVQKKAATGVKDKALYKRLRNLGVSAKESARVANKSEIGRASCRERV